MSLPFFRALVTGGAGFVGSHIVDRLVAENIEVLVLDDFSSGKLSNLGHSQRTGKVKVIKGDINDRDLARSALRDIEVVFHDAAIVSVQRSIAEPELTNRVNIAGTKNMIEACADAGVKRFIFASSSAVYGDSKVLPRTEFSETSPISPYAFSKLEGEIICRQFQELTGIETIALRYFNIYGLRSTAKAYSGVINAMAQKIAANEKPMIFGDGKQSRDFINVSDIVEANILAAISNVSKAQVFNVGTGKQTTILDLVSLESKILLGTTSIDVDFKESLTGDVRHSWADITQIKEKLGFRPRINLENGLQAYLKTIYIPAVEENHRYNSKL